MCEAFGGKGLLVELWEEPSLWWGDGKPSPWFGDITGVTWVPASPKLLVLLTLGCNADCMAVTQKRAKKTYGEWNSCPVQSHALLQRAGHKDSMSAK